MGSMVQSLRMVADWLPTTNQQARIMKDNKYFCYTVSASGERGFQRIDKEYAIQLHNMGQWFYSLPFKVVNSLTKALRWKYHLRD